MKEKPILFSTPMVKAILEGKKTQTRRVINPQPNWCNGKPENRGDHFIYWSPISASDGGDVDFTGEMVKSKYQKGDILWVRETFQKIERNRFIYKADPIIWGGKWKPSIFMPKEAARIFLEVINVRAERLWDISEFDARKEGVEELHEWHEDGTPDEHSFIDSFVVLWDKINGKKHPWATNPWVWVNEFKKKDE